MLRGVDSQHLSERIVEDQHNDSNVSQTECLLQKLEHISKFSGDELSLISCECHSRDPFGLMKMVERKDVSLPRQILSTA